MTEYYEDYYGEEISVNETPEENQSSAYKKPPQAPQFTNGPTKPVPYSFETNPKKSMPPPPAAQDSFPSLSPGATPTPTPTAKPVTNGDAYNPAAADNDSGLEGTWDIKDMAEGFDDMNLKDELSRGIYSYGFEKPSAIQQRAIIPCIKGRDIIAQAQSGTGKTATFVISILQRVDVEKSHVQAMILAPTRELAQQIQKVDR